MIERVVESVRDKLMKTFRDNPDIYKGKSLPSDNQIRQFILNKHDNPNNSFTYVMKTTESLAEKIKKGELLND